MCIRDSLGAGKVNVNRGVDMRTLQTDNIERVEFIRGIPSVEYGLSLIHI